MNKKTVIANYRPVSDKTWIELGIHGYRNSQAREESPNTKTVL